MYCKRQDKMKGECTWNSVTYFPHYIIILIIIIEVCYWLMVEREREREVQYVELALIFNCTCNLYFTKPCIHGNHGLYNYMLHTQKINTNIKEGITIIVNNVYIFAITLAGLPTHIFVIHSPFWRQYLNLFIF